MGNIMMKHIKTLRKPEIGGICENTLLSRKTLIRHLRQYKKLQLSECGHGPPSARGEYCASGPPLGD